MDRSDDSGLIATRPELRGTCTVRYPVRKPIIARAIFTTLAFLLLTGCGDTGVESSVGVSSCGSPPIVVPGEGASWRCISASEGGSLALPGDTLSSLTIPPGALNSNTMITIRAVARPRPGYRAMRFEPDGLVLNTPAILEIAYDSDTSEEPLIRAFHGSSVHPIVDAGSELTNWERADVLGVDTDARTFQIGLEHFSFIYALWGVRDVAYLVLDIPDKYLRPGDIMVALTNGQPNWNPGHVAMFRGNLSGEGLVLESTPPRVRSHRASQSRAIPGPPGAGFRTEFGHVYLGARRPPGGHLTDAERPQISTFLLNKLGLPYSKIGDGTAGTWSCVGLVEKALDDIGRGALDLLNELFYSTPYEMYSGTRPVDSITMNFGDTIEMPVYNVQVVPGPAFTPFFDGWYGKERTRVTATDRPAGATFTGTAIFPFIHSFKWTPTREQIGGDFTILFNTKGAATAGISLALIPFDVTELINIHVSGFQHDFEVHSARRPDTPGAIYGYSEVVPANATIRDTLFIDLATGAAPSATPFPEHELIILSEGRLPGLPLKYGISFLVRSTESPARVLNQPPLQWRYIVDYTVPQYAGN